MQTTININGNTQAVLTTEHSASSYAMPVLVIDGIAYGQSDLLPQLSGSLFGEEHETAKSAVHQDWMARTAEIAKLPTAEYNLVAKFIGLDLAHG